MERSHYATAAVCKRGPVLTRMAEDHPVPKRCSKCGAPILTACPACNRQIRGYLIVPGVIGVGDDYELPDFCHDCAAPYPWASRQGRIYELMNLLDEEKLDPATELEVREQLEALTNPDLRSEGGRATVGQHQEQAPEAGVPLRTLQEWMGHRDLATTQRYTDYAPSSREVDMVAAALARANDSVARPEPSVA